MGMKEGRTLRAAWIGVAASLVAAIGCSGQPEREASSTSAVARPPATGGSRSLSVPPALVHPLVDLEPGTQIVGSNPDNLTAVGDRIYFTATTPNSGLQLWTSDGTPDGTRMVVLLNQNSQTYPPYRGFTAFDGSLFFVGPGAHRATLFRTDGDLESTQIVSPSEAFQPLSSIARLGDALLIAASDYDYGAELWKSDGTSAGTVLLKDIQPGLNGSFPDLLTTVENTVLFVAYDGTGRTLFKSDGTANGTGPVSGAVERPETPLLLTASGNRLFFAATSSGRGAEPWVSDGTTAGTFRLADLVSGSGSSNPQEFTAAGALTFFRATTDQLPNGLFRTDGTAGGTLQLPGPDARHLFARDGGIYFDAALETGGVGRNLWVSDGSDAGTLDIAFLTGSYFGGLFFPVSLGDSFYFANDQGPGYPLGPELWISDGTTAGTHVLVDSIPGPSGTAPTNLAVAGNNIFFSGGDPDTTGAELWVSDGTPGGTHLVLDIATSGLGSDPSTPVVMNNALYFSARVDNMGRKVWRTDGTDGGAVLLSDLGVGAADVVLGPPTVSGHRLFFTAQTGAAGAVQLWASDGTTAGTVAVYGLSSGASYISLPLTPFKGGVLFPGSDSAHGVEPWFSDGTPAGTKLVKDIFVGTDWSNPSQFVVFGDAAYFTAYDGIRTVVWKTDTTEAGTVEALTFFSPSDYIPIMGWTPTVMDGSLYFFTSHALYRSDGTDSGTVALTPATSAAPGLDPRPTVVGHRLFFKFGSSDGLELWSTDGTPAGTAQAVDLTPGPDGTNFGALTAVNGRLFFERLDLSITSGYVDYLGSIWVTDGTPAGTIKLKDVSFRTFPSQVGQDTEYLPMLPLEPEGRVVFLASGVWQGEEPWVSDGTPAGTRPLVEIAPGPASSRPDVPVRFGNAIVLPADDGRIGKELWTVDVSVATDNVPPSLQCPSDVSATLGAASATTVIVNYPAPTASDAVTDVVVDAQPPAGSAFPLGTTTVEVTARDAFANQSSCTFLVTVHPYVAPDAGTPGQGGAPSGSGCSTAGSPAAAPTGLWGILLLAVGAWRRGQPRG